MTGGMAGDRPHPRLVTAHLYNREAAIRNTIIPALGAVRLRQLERRHIQQWVRSLAEAGYGR